MNTSSPRLRNATVVLSTIAAIALAFIGYYYFYVQSQEKGLDARNQRVLTQIRDNVIRKNRTYVQNAVNNSPQNIDQLKRRVIELVNENIRNENERQQKGGDSSSKNLQKGDPMAGVATSELANILRLPPEIPKPKKLPYSSRAKVDVNRNGQQFLISEKIALYSQADTLSFREWQERSNRLTQLRYAITPDTFRDAPVIELEKVQDTMAAFTPWQVNYKVWVQEENEGPDDGYRVTMSIGIKPFIEALERSDIFDGMVLIRQKDEGDNEGTDLIYSSLDQPRVVNYLVEEADRLRKYSPNDTLRLGPLRDLPFRIYDAEMVFQGSRLLLVGLVSQDRFQREKLGISTVAILTMSFIAILVLLSFPLLKLFLMGNFERLSLSDLLLSIMASILGTFLITQLMIDGYGFNGPDRKRRNQQLVELSNEVTDNLNQELSSIILQLRTADNLVNTRKPSGDIVSVWNQDSLALELMRYPYFQSIYWVDPSYKLVREWASGPELAPKITLSDRKYLTGLEANRGWRLPGDTNSLHQFRLESLVARTTGEQLAVVSVPSKSEMAMPGAADTKAVFLSTKLRSLHHPVLPPGFGFAIIDEAGAVWFHSDSRRNLQENFLDETDEPSLQAAIGNRAPLKISGSYLGKDHEFYLKPLTGMPLHLVVFQETNVYRSTHAQILSLTFFLIIAAFLTGLSFILIQVLVNPRSPLLKDDQFTFDWLRPDQAKRRSYRMLILINLTNFLLAVFFSIDYQHGLPVLCMIGLLYIYTFILAFLKLNRNSHREFLWEEHRRIVFTTGALLVVSNFLFVVLMGWGVYTNLFLFQLLPFAFLVREVGIILLPRMLVREEWWKGYAPMEANVSLLRKLFYQLLGIGDRLLATIGAGIEKGIMKLIPRDLILFFHAQMSYRWFLLSWLVILSVFPVVRFYEFSYNQESIRLLKYGQIQLLKDWETHEAEDENWWSQYPGSSLVLSDSAKEQARHTLIEAGIYTGPFFNSVIHRNVGEKQPEDLVRYSPLIMKHKHTNVFPFSRNVERRLPAFAVFDSALSILRPYYTDQARLTHRLPPNNAAGENLQWQEYDLLPKDKDSSFFRSLYVEKRVLELSRGDDAYISSDLPFYHIPSFWRFTTGSRFFFWALMLVFILSIYYLIKFAVRKFFALDFVEQADPDPLATTQSLSNLRRHIYLTIPPRSTVRDYLGLLENREDIDAIVGDTPREGYVFDLRKKSDIQRLLAATDHFPKTEPAPSSASAKEEANKLPSPRELPMIILDHLEAKSGTKEDCEELLMLISALLETGPLITLICTETPVTLQRMMVLALAGPQEENSPAQEFAEASWSRVLGEFTRIDYPLALWEKLPYEQITSGDEELESFFRNRHPFYGNGGALAQFYFLAPAVLKFESKKLLDEIAQSGRKKIAPKLFERFGFHSARKGNSQFTLDWTSDDHSAFLIDDQSSPTQIRELIDRLEEVWQEKISGESIKIFSTLAPQEIVQLLIREDHLHKDYIQKWDKLVHRLELVEVVREFRHIAPEDRVAEIIREECMYDPFLQGLQSHMRQYLAWLDVRLDARLDKGHRAGDRRLREAVIVEIEQQAHLYYQALWNTCSEAEHYLIYDLAQDGLVNTHNKTDLDNLIRKGIIVRGTDSLELINHSFRNFVLTVVNEKEALAMERKIRQEGNWNRIRVPITLILMAFAIFIFYFQADWFDDTLGLLTAFAAVIPALNGVFDRIANFQIPGLSQFSGMFKKKT